MNMTLSTDSDLIYTDILYDKLSYSIRNICKDYIYVYFIIIILFNLLFEILDP